MLTSLLPVSHTAQRVLLAVLLAPALLAVTAAALPALVALPFLGDAGIDRAVKLLRAHAAYARTLLRGAHADPEIPGGAVGAGRGRSRRGVRPGPRRRR